MTAETVAMTGDQNINAVLSGVRWAGTVFTYGFPTGGANYGAYEYKQDHDNNPDTPAITIDETDGFVAFNAQQQAAAENAFTEFRRLTNDVRACRRIPAAAPTCGSECRPPWAPAMARALTRDYPATMDGAATSGWILRTTTPRGSARARTNKSTTRSAMRLA